MFLKVPKGTPLLMLMVNEDGQEYELYFAGEEALAAYRAQHPPRRSLDSLIGAWSDLDADEVLRELDRIRHETPPTPPVDLWPNIS